MLGLRNEDREILVAEQTLLRDGVWQPLHRLHLLLHLHLQPAPLHLQLKGALLHQHQEHLPNPQPLILSPPLVATLLANFVSSEECKVI